MHKHTLLLSAWLFGLLITLGCESEKTDPQTVASSGPAELRWHDDAQGGALPIRLTGSDGHGLSLVSLRAEAIVQAPLAFTELHLKFENPEDRQREGRFEITLPPGAAISRFAMRVGDRFQEGEVVERRAAQVAYEDFLHRRQDPALLEQAAANRFSARVFPIGPREEKELILSYTETLSDSRAPYRLHLSGLPAMRELSVRVLAGADELELSQRDFAPRGDLTLAGADAGGADLAVQSEGLVMARVTPKFDDSPAPLEGLLIAFDTSASTALGFRDRVKRLGSLIDALRAEYKRDFPVQLVAFDQTTELLFKGKASQLTQEGLPALAKRMPLGATDLSRTLSDLAKVADQPRLLWLTDAVVTAGDEALAEGLRKLSARGVKRVDVVLLGGIHDDELAQKIAAGPFERAGTVQSEHAPQAELVRALSLHAHADLPVRVDGASWSWPHTVPSLQSGQAVVVLAKRDKDGPIKVAVGDNAPLSLTPLSIHKALLERAWAQGRIAELEAEQDALPADDRAQRATLSAEATALSVRHRVLSRRTALLVLETEADYARFDIPRTALSDIMTVGEQGLEVLTGAQRAEQLVAFGARGQDRPQKAMAERTRRPGSNSAMEAPMEVDDAEEAEPAEERDGERERATVTAAAALPDEAPRRQAPRPTSMPAPAAPPPAPAAEPAPNRMVAAKRSAPRSMADVLSDEAVSGNAADVLSQAAGVGVATEMRARGGLGGLARRSGSGGNTLQVAEGSAVRETRMRGRVLVRPGSFTDGKFDASLVVRTIRMRARAIQACYERELLRNPNLRGTIAARFTIQTRGHVTDVQVTSNGVRDANVAHCVENAIARFRFNPGPQTPATYATSFAFEPQRPLTIASPTRPRPSPAERAARQQRARERALAADMAHEWEGRPGPDPAGALEGALLEIIVAADAGNIDSALTQAWRFRAEAPGDVLALLALGHALTTADQPGQAARAYGSVIDLFPGRADLRRMAGNYLERLSQASSDPRIAADALSLASDSYGRAREQRPDHPNSHRLHAFSLVKRGDYEQAFKVLREGYGRSYPDGRFAGAKEILGDDLRIVAQAWRAAWPKQASEVDAALSALDLTPDETPSLRFVLSWETDANDVDFHVYDGKHGHAFYGRRELPSGGSLLADVTTGYGPECFRIDRPKAYPYEMSAHYYARGPMGYGMGKVQVIGHDGHGSLTFDERPFVIMKDRAFIHLGMVDAPPKPTG